MTSPLGDVTRHIVGVLTADSALSAALGSGQRIWLQPAPPDASYPLVVLQPLGAFDRTIIDGARVLTDGTWRIMAWARADSMTAVENIAARVDAVLHGSSGIIGPTTIKRVLREAPATQTEIVDGARYVAEGGTYRAWWHT